MHPSAKSFIESCGLTEIQFLQTCTAYDIGASLLLGLVRAESWGDAGAMRYEPGYRWLCDPGKYAGLMNWTIDTETHLQRFSFGLCQIMLATARSIGFEKHPMILLRPVVGLNWGACYLRRMYDRYENWEDAVSAYNQGSNRKWPMTKRYMNQGYVNRVMKYADSFRDDPEV